MPRQTSKSSLIGTNANPRTPTSPLRFRVEAWHDFLEPGLREPLLGFGLTRLRWSLVYRDENLRISRKLLFNG